MSLNSKSILIFTDWYTPAYKAGGPITSLANLVFLLKDEYQFFIVTGDRDLGELTPLKDIKTNIWVEGKNGEQVFYLTNSKINKKLFHFFIEVSKSKVLFFNSLFSVNFTIKPLLYSKKLDCQRYLAPRGMLHPQALSQKNLKKSAFLGLFKSFSVFKKTTIVATNKIESEYIRQANIKNKIAELPNVPDLSFFNNPIVHKPNILVVSRIAEEKNSLFALDTFNHLSKSAHIHWIGEAVDERYKKEFLKRAEMLNGSVKLILHGALPKEAFLPIFNKCSIFYLPTLGENYGHAIFEALAAGKPALIGQNTPFADLEAHNAGHLDILDSCVETAELLGSMLSMSDTEYTTKANNARDFAMASFNANEIRLAYKEQWK